VVVARVPTIFAEYCSCQVLGLGFDENPVYDLGKRLLQQHLLQKWALLFVWPILLVQSRVRLLLRTALLTYVLLQPGVLWIDNDCGYCWYRFGDLGWWCFSLCLLSEREVVSESRFLQVRESLQKMLDWSLP